MEEPEFTSLEAARVRRFVMRDAMAALENAVARAAAAEDWRTTVVHALVDLRAALDAHVHEVEGPGGILADLVSRAPRLSAGVEDLRSDHERLAGTLSTVLSRAHDLSTSDLRARSLEILGELAEHRMKGADLVYEAFNADIGGQG